MRPGRVHIFRIRSRLRGRRTLLRRRKTCGHTDRLPSLGFRRCCWQTSVEAGALAVRTCRRWSFQPLALQHSRRRSLLSLVLQTLGHSPRYLRQTAGRCLRRGCRERLELVDQARESTGVAVFAAAEVDAAVVDPSKVRTSCAGVGSVRRLCARVARLVAAAMIQLPSAHWPVRSVKNFARMGMMDGGKRRKPRLPFGAWRQTQPVSAEARETLVEFRENDRIG
jgi:hypothetical protein